MSKALAKLTRLARRDEADRLPSDELRAFKRAKAEATDKGATLKIRASGGLKPSLILGLLRRDEFQCKRCGGNADLSVHHKGNLENPTSVWLKQKGKSNDFNNLVTICGDCHDAIHDLDREGDVDADRS